MIQESGSCLVSARGWQFLTPPSDEPTVTPRRISGDERVRLHRTRRRRRVRTFKRTTTTDVYSHATARRVRRRGRLCDRATIVVNTPAHSSAGLDQTTLSAICELMCSAQRAAGCPVHPINYILIVLLCTDSPISCNIYVFEVYKGHMGTPSHPRPQLFRKHRQVDRRRRRH